MAGQNQVQVSRRERTGFCHIIIHCFGPLQWANSAAERISEVSSWLKLKMLKNCYNTVELWKAWKQPCSSSILIFFLQSVDTLHNSTERVHLLCTKPNHRRLFMFTAPRQQNNETKKKKTQKRQLCLRGDSEMLYVWNIMTIYFKWSTMD